MAANTETSTQQNIKIENNDVNNKKAEKKVKNDKVKKKGKLKRLIIIFVVMFVLIAIFFAIGRFNILNLGDAMSKIPGIGAIVSPSSNKTTKTAVKTTNLNINKLSKAKLKTELENQMKLNAKLLKQKDSLAKVNTAYKDEISNYKVEIQDYNSLKNVYKKLLSQNADMQKAIVTANPKLFVKQYEKLNPTLAKQLYSSMKALTTKQKALETNLKTMAAYYTKMDAEVAANALVKMYAKNKTLTVEIMSRINNKTLAEIFASIDSDTVQKMTQDLYLAGVKKVNNSY